MNGTEEPALKPDDLDWPGDHFGDLEADEDAAPECQNCFGSIEEGLVGSYCQQCIYLMER